MQKSSQMTSKKNKNIFYKCVKKTKHTIYKTRLCVAITLHQQTKNQIRHEFYFICLNKYKSKINIKK